MKTHDLLCEALEIHPPWQIVRLRNDLGKQQLDVWVARESPRRGWIFAARQAPPGGPERIWRHINVGQARCLVHAVPSPELTDAAPPWAGGDDQVFTHALTRQIATHFMEGVKFQTICKLLDIPVGDLWRFKHNLDNGKIALSGREALIADRVQAAGDVPDTDDPVWRALLAGTREIDIRVLGLKLLLTKLRGQVQLISDPEVRLMKAHELHHYFVRHAPQLAHELEQIRAEVRHDLH
ncbi:MAG: hypothetical protein DWQ11_17590 [Proteobacteria bacterium]|nr:MAG: hypothetical protein DWQ11_17590 [Pseudomonadota bacterium]